MEKTGQNELEHELEAGFIYVCTAGIDLIIIGCWGRLYLAIQRFQRENIT